MELPHGVTVRPLQMHADERGVFTEIFRREWQQGADPVQWNVVRSAAGVMRGVHVHPRHDDYLILLEGRATIGLRDLRQGSPSEGLATLVELHGEELSALTIPHGVAHGFYFHQPSVHVYAVSHYWDPADEKGCLWSDPELGIPWPVTGATVSERDRAAQPFAALLAELEPLQPLGTG